MVRHWSIEHQFLLLALLPAALTTLVLTVYHAQGRAAAVEERAIQQAHAAADQWVLIAAASPQSEQLQHALHRSIAANPDIVGARLLDDDHAIMIETPESGSTDESVGMSRNLTRTVQRNVDKDVLAAGLPESASTPAAIEFDVDLTPVRATRANALLEGGLLSLLALAATGVLVQRVSRRVVHPIRDMTATVERIANRDHDADVTAMIPGEMGRLQQGVATMVAEIRDSQAELETRVQSATHDLQSTMHQLEARNAELNEARLVAEAASEFKSRFLANISHEIRTPMNSILGFTELLQESRLDPVHADYVETIHESALSLLSLLNSLLDLSKIESGRMELEKAEFDLNQIFAEIFRLLGPGAFQKGVEFVVLPVYERRSHVIGDALRVKQILMNLTANAIKFTDTGRVVLSPATRITGDGLIDVRIRVEDTGCGISRECRGHLFEAFAQGEATAQTQARGGTGLGLHIASELVFLMDGHIEFESEPGWGSIFEVSMRFPAAQRPATAGPRHLLRPGRIILVEGHAQLRAKLAQLFRTAGADCKPVASPDAAIRMASGEDVIVMHLAANRIRTDHLPDRHRVLNRTDIPVLAYSHIHDASTRDAIAGAGYDGIIAKTADPDELRQSLTRTLAHKATDHAEASIKQLPNRDIDLPRLESVLIADDHPVNRKLLQRYMVNHSGMQELAESGAEALFLASSQAFDVILLDLHMPDINGLEIARRIREHSSRNRSTPIFMITADKFALQETQPPNHIADFIAKPVRQRDLLARIAAHCAGKEATGNTDPDDSGNGDDIAKGTSDQASLVDDLRVLLLQSLPESRDAIAAAIDARDPVALRAATHRLHGAVAYCDEPDLKALAEQAERSILHGKPWSEVAEMGHRLLATIDDLRRNENPPLSNPPLSV